MALTNLNAVPLKNLAINGAFDYWQRFEGGTQTLTSAGEYVADMYVSTVSGSSTKSISFQRSTSVPTIAQSGFNSTYSFLCTSNTAVPSLAANENVCVAEYRMEGLDYEKIHAKTITLNFWMNASVAGVYSIYFLNNAGTRSYITTVTQTSASVWQLQSVTLTLDSAANSASWNFDNTVGLKIGLCAISGSTTQTANLNQWQAGGFLSATTGTNWLATAGATVQLAQFSIAEGPIGTTVSGFLRAGNTIQQELALCQRYYEKSYDIGTAPGTASSVGVSNFTAVVTGQNINTLFFRSTKRTEGTVTFYAYAAANTTANWTLNGTTNTAATLQVSGTNSISVSVTGSSGNPNLAGHWTVESGL